MPNHNQKTKSLYVVSEMNIVCDFKIPFLKKSSKKSCKNSILIFEKPIPCNYNEIDWYYQYSKKKPVPLSFGKCRNGYVISFSEGYYFWISLNGKTIHCPTTNQVACERVIFHVLPYALRLQGKIVLHASCIERKNKASLFIGHTGIGKSTLAYFLAQKTFRFVSDDFVTIEFDRNKALVTPTLSFSRLWNNAHTQKKMHASRFSKYKKIPVKNIFFLSLKNKNCIKKISQPKAAQKILESTFRLDFDSKKALSQEFKFVSKLLQLQQYAELSYPKNISNLKLLSRFLIESAL